MDSLKIIAPCGQEFGLYIRDSTLKDTHITFKNKERPIKNEAARTVTTFLVNGSQRLPC